MKRIKHTCKWCYTALEQKHTICPICLGVLKTKQKPRRRRKKSGTIKTRKSGAIGARIKHSYPWLAQDPCVYCRRPVGKARVITIGHIDPIAKGGEKYDYSNAAAACWRCNQDKADKKLLLFLAER